jgi:AraC-like DNA-binding protein
MPSPERGWLAGFGDPVVGRALSLLHARQDHHWTVDKLADESGLSRSAFADRFTRIMGESPMRYLAQQRLQAAATRLESSPDSIARIAFEVGYESEAAFNRAFKRAFGSPPATWRESRVSPRPSP